MKKVVKVIVIINMIIGVFFIVPPIYGSKVLSKLDKVCLKQELVGTGILSLFLLSPITGILILCLKDEHLFENIPEQYNTLKVDREQEMIDRIDEPYKSKGYYSKLRVTNIDRGRMAKK